MKPANQRIETRGGITHYECIGCHSLFPRECFYDDRFVKRGFKCRCEACYADASSRREKTYRPKAIKNRREIYKHRWRVQGDRREPLKVRAGQILNYCVRAGKITKPNNCADCGVVGARLDGHHEDYSKPLDVIWLCRPCHGKRHRKYDKNCKPRQESSRA